MAPPSVDPHRRSCGFEESLPPDPSEQLPYKEASYCEEPTGDDQFLSGAPSHSWQGTAAPFKTPFFFAEESPWQIQENPTSSPIAGKTKSKDDSFMAQAAFFPLFLVGLGPSLYNSFYHINDGQWVFDIYAVEHQGLYRLKFSPAGTELIPHSVKRFIGPDFEVDRNFAMEALGNNSFKVRSQDGYLEFEFKLIYQNNHQFEIHPLHPMDRSYDPVVLLDPWIVTAHRNNRRVNEPGKPVYHDCHNYVLLNDGLVVHIHYQAMADGTWADGVSVEAGYYLADNTWAGLEADTVAWELRNHGEVFWVQLPDLELSIPRQARQRKVHKRDHVVWLSKSVRDYQLSGPDPMRNFYDYHYGLKLWAPHTFEITDKDRPSLDGSRTYYSRREQGLDLKINVAPSGTIKQIYFSERPASFERHKLNGNTYLIFKDQDTGIVWKVQQGTAGLHITEYNHEVVRLWSSVEGASKELSLHPLANFLQLAVRTLWKPGQKPALAKAIRLQRLSTLVELIFGKPQPGLKLGPLHKLIYGVELPSTDVVNLPRVVGEAEWLVFFSRAAYSPYDSKRILKVLIQGLCEGHFTEAEVVELLQPCSGDLSLEDWLDLGFQVDQRLKDKNLTEWASNNEFDWGSLLYDQLFNELQKIQQKRLLEGPALAQLEKTIHTVERLSPEDYAAAIRLLDHLQRLDEREGLRLWVTSSLKALAFHEHLVPRQAARLLASLPSFSESSDPNFRAYFELLDSFPKAAFAESISDIITTYSFSNSALLNKHTRASLREAWAEAEPWNLWGQVIPLNGNAMEAEVEHPQALTWSQGDFTLEITQAGSGLEQAQLSWQTEGEDPETVIPLSVHDHGSFRLIHTPPGLEGLPMDGIIFMQWGQQVLCLNAPAQLQDLLALTQAQQNGAHLSQPSSDLTEAQTQAAIAWRRRLSAGKELTRGQVLGLLRFFDNPNHSSANSPLRALQIRLRGSSVKDHPNFEQQLEIALNFSRSLSESLGYDLLQQQGLEQAMEAAVRSYLYEREELSLGEEARAMLGRIWTGQFSAGLGEGLDAEEQPSTAKDWIRRVTKPEGLDTFRLSQRCMLAVLNHAATQGTLDGSQQTQLWQHFYLETERLRRLEAEAHHSRRGI